MKEKYDENLINNFIEENVIDRINELKQINRLLSFGSIRIGINGKWGTGKTVLAKIIFNLSHNLYHGQRKSEYEECLNNIITSKVVYFNASREDIFENPLLSLTKVLAKELNKEKELSNSNFWSGMQEMFSNVTIVKEILNIVKSGKEAATSTPLYEEILGTEEIIKKINKIFDKNEKYILLIDELDRCNPKYILSMFNTIKYFYNLDNLSIVYFYNYEELWNIIENEYGYKNQNFIQKYIDFEIEISSDYNLNYANRKMLKRNYVDNFTICTLLYELTLREINNLAFIVNNFRDTSIVFYLVITHYIIKREDRDIVDVINQKIIEAQTKHPDIDFSYVQIKMQKYNENIGRYKDWLKKLFL